MEFPRLKRRQLALVSGGCGGAQQAQPQPQQQQAQAQDPGGAAPAAAPGFDLSALVKPLSQIDQILQAILSSLQPQQTAAQPQPTQPT